VIQTDPFNCSDDYSHLGGNSAQAKRGLPLIFFAQRFPQTQYDARVDGSFFRDETV
jgi:hypothetical protein